MSTMTNNYALVNHKGVALDSPRYTTAKAAKIAATRLGYTMICKVSPYSWQCYEVESKVNNKWRKQ